MAPPVCDAFCAAAPDRRSAPAVHRNSAAVRRRSRPDELREAAVRNGVSPRSLSSSVLPVREPPLLFPSRQWRRRRYPTAEHPPSLPGLFLRVPERIFPQFPLFSPSLPTPVSQFFSQVRKAPADRPVRQPAAPQRFHRKPSRHFRFRRRSPTRRFHPLFRRHFPFSSSMQPIPPASNNGYG